MNNEKLKKGKGRCAQKQKGKNMQEESRRRQMLVIGLLSISLLPIHSMQSNHQVPFDGLFLVNPYKPLVVEAYELLADLHEIRCLEVYKDRLAGTDILVGRTVRLMSAVDSLIKQSKEECARHQDAVDLIDILDQVQDAYKKLDTFSRYHLLFPLLTDVQHKITQAYL